MAMARSVGETGDGGDGQSAPARDVWVQPALLALVAGVIVLYRIGSFGLWSDEAFSVSTSLRPWGSLARLSVNTETNGVLYAFFLKLWAFAGTSEVWLRMPSAIAFVSAVFLTCVLGRRLHGQATGAIAGGLVALHGSLLQYGQNIRFYAPVVAVGLGFVICVHRSLERPTKGAMWSVAVLGFLLPLLHLVAATLMFGAVGIFWIDSITRNRVGINATRSLSSRLAALVPGLLAASAVAALVSSRDEGQSINLALGRDAVAEVLLTLTGSGGILGLAGYGLLLVASLVTLPSLVRTHVTGGGRPVDVLLPWIVIVVTALFVGAGSVVTTLMVGRYVLFLVPYLAVAAALGIVGATRFIDTSSDNATRRLGGMTLPTASPQPWGASRLVTVGTLCAVLLLGVAGAASGAIDWTLRNDRTDWRPVVRTLMDQATRDDAVLFANDSTRLFVEYELRRSPDRVARAPEPVFPPQAWGLFRTGDQKYAPFSPGEVEAALASHKRVWLVVEQPLVEAPLPELVTVLARHHPSQQTMFDQTGSLYLLERVEPGR